MFQQCKSYGKEKQLIFRNVFSFSTGLFNKLAGLVCKIKESFNKALEGKIWMVIELIDKEN